MTPAERALLREVFRWARQVGVRLDGGMRWDGPPPRCWGVDYWHGQEYLLVWRASKNTGKEYFVTSVAEAVDVLVALGILPARFSTAYAAGWQAAFAVVDRGIRSPEPAAWPELRRAVP